MRPAVTGSVNSNKWWWDGGDGREKTYSQLVGIQKPLKLILGNTI